MSLLDTIADADRELLKQAADLGSDHELGVGSQGAVEIAVVLHVQDTNRGDLNGDHRGWFLDCPTRKKQALQDYSTQQQQKRDQEDAREPFQHI